VSDRIWISELSWVEYQRRLSENAIVIVPVGSLEQHGHHLPLGVDMLLANAIAERVAHRIDALVAPGIPYGYKSQPRTGGGDHFPGTTGLDGATLTGVVRDVIRQLARHGAKKIAIVDGHFENEMFLTEAVDLAIRELPRDGVRDTRVVKLRYFEEVPEETIRLLWPDDYPGMGLEHAALMETSMMLHIAPELVDLAIAPDERAAEFPGYDSYPPDGSLVPPSGALSSPRRATARFGEHLVETFVDAVTTALTEGFG
jgi:creatinine amidohydrolase